MDIFSDDTSRNKRYKHLYNQALYFGMLMLTYLILFEPSLIQISSWYLKGNLWSSYSGLQLAGMIVLETFFLLVQVMPILFFLVALIYYMIVGTKAKKYLNKNQIDK